MPEQRSFAERYKKLVDHNFAPSPARSAAALETVLRQLDAEYPQNCGIPVDISPKL